MLCNPKDFKEKGTNYVPYNDVTIIRNLLIEAVNDSKESMIVDWFNGKIDTSDSQMAIQLFMQLKYIIMKPYMEGETDEVTMDEWLNTIAAAINYSTAKSMVDLQDRLEKFRNSSLPLDVSIGYGNIIVTYEDGFRSYATHRNKHQIDIRGKTVEKILDEVVTQHDYFTVIVQLLEMFDIHAKKRAKKYIEVFAGLKEVFGAKKADDSIERDSIASEYVIWYQRVHEFLRDNPDICKEIEEKSNTKELVEFFCMQDR